MVFPLGYALSLGVLGVLLAGYCTTRLIDRVKRSFVSRFPVGSKSRVTIPEAGTFVLNIETPRMSLADLGMGSLTMSGTIRDVETGREAPLRLDLTGASVTGISNTRRALFRFRVERAGSYELSIAGIPEREGLERCSFVLSRPLGLAFVPLILGIILGAAAIILSIVLPLALSGSTDTVAASIVGDRRFAP